MMAPHFYAHFPLQCEPAHFLHLTIDVFLVILRGRPNCVSRIDNVERRGNQARPRTRRELGEGGRGYRSGER